MPSDRTRGNGYKLKNSNSHLKIRKNLFTVKVTEQWNRLPREVVEPSSSEILKTQLDTVLSSLL